MAYALVRWNVGKDKGLYSVILTEWIQRFNIREVSLGGVQKSYNVEWREGDKKPIRGWPVYKGNVIEISDSKMNLYRLLEGMSFKQESEAFVENANIKMELSTRQQSDLESEWNLKSKYEEGVYQEITSLICENKKLRMECCALRVENAQLKSGSSKAHIPTLLARVDNLVERLDRLEAARSNSQPAIRPTPTATPLSKMSSAFELKLESPTPQDPRSTIKSPVVTSLSLPNISPVANPSVPLSVKFQIENPYSDSTLVELHSGTGVMVDSAVLSVAKLMPTCYGFVNYLLPYLFTKDVMLCSSFRGKKCVGRQNWEYKPALDERVTDAMYRALLEVLPDTQMKTFGMSINAKLHRLRQGNGATAALKKPCSKKPIKEGGIKRRSRSSQ